LTVQMLFYENAVPVAHRRHAGCSVELRGYGFCRHVNAVPLTAAEFRSAAGEYPIVFAEGEVPQPVVVLGVRKAENLFVSEAGEWTGRYIPAFVRRYPFVFSSSGPDAQRFALCVDEAFEGFNREGRGQALFDGDGEPSPYVGRVLRFLQEYRAQFLRTRAFAQRLKEMDLLEPMQARIPAPGRQLAVGGFSVVRRDRLKALPGERLSQLAAGDELELLYLHLQSLRHFEALRNRLPPEPEPPLDLAGVSPAGDAGSRITIH
jgi:hypothetical protein